MQNQIIVPVQKLGLRHYVLLTTWLNVDVLGMLLLLKLFEAKLCTILINVREHVGVLIAAKPFILPVKAHRLSGHHQLLHHFVVIHVTCVQIPQVVDNHVELS